MAFEDEEHFPFRNLVIAVIGAAIIVWILLFIFGEAE